MIDHKPRTPKGKEQQSRKQSNASTPTKGVRKVTVAKDPHKVLAVKFMPRNCASRLSEPAKTNVPPTKGKPPVAPPQTSGVNQNNLADSSQVRSRRNLRAVS